MDNDNVSDRASDGPEPDAKSSGEMEEVLMRDTPSPVMPSEDRSEHETRSAPSQWQDHAHSLRGSQPSWKLSAGENLRVSSAVCDRHRSSQARYLTGFQVLPNSTSSCLRPGSKFVGTQQSDRQVYNVQVELKYVDMEESFLCGYLRIQGTEYPGLSLFGQD